MLIKGRATQKLKQLEMGRMGSKMREECYFETGQWLGIQCTEPGLFEQTQIQR